jgi:hypothetical protein
MLKGELLGLEQINKLGHNNIIGRVPQSVQLDGPGIESRWRYRVFPRGKAAGAWC